MSGELTKTQAETLSALIELQSVQGGRPVSTAQVAERLDIACAAAFDRLNRLEWRGPNAYKGEYDSLVSARRIQGKRDTFWWLTERGFEAVFGDSAAANPHPKRGER